jgi:hypothetical protein
MAKLSQMYLGYHLIRTYGYFRAVGDLVAVKSSTNPSVEFFMFTGGAKKKISTVASYDAFEQKFDAFDEYFVTYYSYK